MDADRPKKPGGRVICPAVELHPGDIMIYRITKDCGTGWDEMHDEFTETAWGVSERQRSLAEKVCPGDGFLHYIDRAHVWACHRCPEMGFLAAL